MMGFGIYLFLDREEHWQNEQDRVEGIDTVGDKSGSM